jgi:hypothetical protein
VANPNYYSDQARVRLSKVQPEEVEWLWPEYIPRRAITILDGNPALGKSLLALDIAARLTTGRPMPDGTYGAWGDYPQDVLLLCGEDDLPTTIWSRLIAASANLDLVHALRASVDYDERTEREVGLRRLLLPRDMDDVESAIMSTNANLIIVDPLMVYLEPRISSWRDQEVRAALAPMAAFAQLGHLWFLPNLPAECPRLEAWG